MNERTFFIVPLVAALLFGSHGLAQGEKAFSTSDTSKIDFLNKWLQGYHLDTLLHLNAIQPENEKIFVKGTFPGKAAWVEHSRLFTTKNEISLPEFLFRKIAFQFNNPTEVVVELEGKNAYVFITGSDSSVKYDLQMKMANITDSFYVPIQDIKTVGEMKEFETKNSVDQLQNKITAGLKSFFSRYKIEGLQFDYTPIPLPYKSELIINVRKIKKAALERPVSWEKYAIVIKFRKEGQKLLLHLTVNGAFGPGIGPKETLNYFDLEQYHPEAMTIFSAKISSELQRILTSQ